MAHPINPLFVDLSHWDPADDYEAVKADGIVAVCYKATEGQSYTDPTYLEQRRAAKAAGLKFGSYHFADASGVGGQIDNYLRFADPGSDEMICLDWEDNPSGGGKMPVANVRTWIAEVENRLGRGGQCVLYSGNTAKEMLGDDIDVFLGARRLWLCQYGTSPVVQSSWATYDYWQFTDGEFGPQPHSIAGIGPCDINSYAHGADRLVAEWATGANAAGERPPEGTNPPHPERPARSAVVKINIVAQGGVFVLLNGRVVPLGDDTTRAARVRGGDTPRK